MNISKISKLCINNALLTLSTKRISEKLPSSRLYCTAEVGTKSYFEEILKKQKVVIFMKGTPDAPKCGFSNAVVQVMRMHGVTYDSHNVLENENLRQGIKDYSEWPTIPQIYLNGEFVGGCDILIQMHQSGDLIDQLKKVGITSALLEKEMEKDKEK